MDGVLVGPDDGERVSRGPRDHRILAELPELEVVELRFGPDFDGVEPHSHADYVDSSRVKPSSCWENAEHGIRRPAA